MLNQTKLHFFFSSCFCIAGLISRYRRSAEIPHHLKGLELTGEIWAVELTIGSSFTVITHRSNAWMSGVSVLSRRQDAIVLLHVSVVSPAQIELLYLCALHFCFCEAFLLVRHLCLSRSCCLGPAGSPLALSSPFLSRRNSPSALLLVPLVWNLFGW